MKKSVRSHKRKVKSVTSSYKNKTRRKKRKSIRRFPLFISLLFILVFFFTILFFGNSKETPEGNNPQTDENFTSQNQSSQDYTPVNIYVSNSRILVKRIYSADDFGIETVKSSSDYNNNGIDDYTDILLGARSDAQNTPVYEDSYWEGGYPPDNIGVCSDLIWRAFKNAGYCLKCMIDRDISRNISHYPRVEWFHDSDIDFRRVPNLKVFFEKYGISLTTDTEDISQWQPGDIVVFGDYHIGIISDKRNRYGIPYLLHNSGQPDREEDALVRVDISGHYRFDASKLDDSVLIPFS